MTAIQRTPLLDAQISQIRVLAKAAGDLAKLYDKDGLPLLAQQTRAMAEAYTKALNHLLVKREEFINEHWGGN